MTRKTFPKLFRKTATGAVDQWEISVAGRTITTRWGQIGGSLQTTSEVIAAGKVLGRVDETTPEEQAVLEAGGYVENTLRMWSQETAGRIVEEQSPEYTPLDSAGVRWVRVFLRARVELETGTPDAGFQGQVTADQPAYREGDLIRLAVASSRQARAYLFAVQPSGAARLIWPNRFDTLNTVIFGDTLNLPRSGSGYVFTAELDRSAPVPQSEMVLAVFTRGPNQVFTPAEAFERAFTLAELNTRVMRVPRDARTDSWTVYSIEAARSANEPRR